jgi:hypothetical protein
LRLPKVKLLLSRLSTRPYPAVTAAARNLGQNRANDRNGNAFANNTSDRRQNRFSAEQHQDRRIDLVKLAMAMRARFSSKDPKSQFSGGTNENIL